jgi:hypothetical protein
VCLTNNNAKEKRTRRKEGRKRGGEDVCLNPYKAALDTMYVIFFLRRTRSLFKSLLCEYGKLTLNEHIRESKVDYLHIEIMIQEQIFSF